jgi:hypothetical protein
MGLNWRERINLKDMSLQIRRRRSRIVSFRLSQEEFDSLKDISATHGANSVSEYTRAAAFGAEMDANGRGAERLEKMLLHLEERLESLGNKLQQVINWKNQ